VINVKPTNRRRRRDPRARHATAMLLLDATVELLETVPVNELSLAMVLERCGVSHGSVYYHFEDFTNLVEEAVVVRFEAGLKESLVGIEAMLDSRDAAEFRQRAEELAVKFGSPERRSFRLSRIEVFAATKNRPDFAAKIAQSQQSVIDQQGELYAEFQRRGWLRSDLDPMVMSAVIVSILFGRVVDDLSARPVAADDWNAVWMQAVRAILFPA
jgi:AcrR family transcriptional regulator